MKRRTTERILAVRANAGRGCIDPTEGRLSASQCRGRNRGADSQFLPASSPLAEEMLREAHDCLLLSPK